MEPNSSATISQCLLFFQRTDVAGNPHINPKGHRECRAARGPRSIGGIQLLKIITYNNGANTSHAQHPLRREKCRWENFPTYAPSHLLPCLGLSLTLSKFDSCYWMKLSKSICIDYEHVCVKISPISTLLVGLY